MRLTPVYLLLLAAALFGGMSSCNSNEKNRTPKKSSNPDVEIISETFDFDMLSARQLYLVKSDSLTYYMTLEANVQYPEEIGDFDLKHLKDTLGYFIDSKTASSIEEAITSFVSNPQIHDVGDSYLRVDSIPSGFDQTMALYSNVDIKVQEITSDMLTFNCVYETYLGGAHPMYGSVPFTYLLESGDFVNYKWLFNPGSEEAVTAQIRNAIMMENDLTDEQFDSMLLVPLLPIPETIYLEDGMIVFHYNPYAILPYSFGIVDAKVSPYLVSELLTPAAKAFLID